MSKLDDLNPRVKLTIGITFVIITITIFALLNMGVFNEKREQLDLENANVQKLYSYVYNAHYFETLDNDTLVPVDGLFIDNKVEVQDLSNDYKMSMVFALFDSKDRISKSSFNSVYNDIFNEEPDVSEFESYVMSNIGKVKLEGNYYLFNNESPITDAPMGYGYVLVRAIEKKNTIELYDVMYLNNEIDALGNENFERYEYYGKDEQLVFAYDADKTDFDVTKAIIDNAYAFEEYKTTFKKLGNDKYALKSVEKIH